MEKIRVTACLKEAWLLTWRYCFVWLGGLGMAAVLVFLLDGAWDWSAFVLPDLEPVLGPVLRAVFALLSSILMAYILKFALLMVRNPQLVRKHFLQAVWYSLSDGLPMRLLQTFIFFLISGMLLFISAYLLFYLFLLLYPLAFSTFASVVVVVLLILLAPLLYLPLSFCYFYLVDSHIFLMSYIIQDTHSADNLLRPLSLAASFGKSFSLIGGYRAKYALLNVCLVSLLLGSIYVDYFLQRVLDFSRVSGGWDFYFVLGIRVFFFVVDVGLLVFFYVARTVFANALMERDSEIVDFGD